VKRKRFLNHLLVLVMALSCWPLQGCDFASILKAVGPILTQLGGMLGTTTATPTAAATPTATVAATPTPTATAVATPTATATVAPGLRLLGQ
jgi:hypothetical protein